MRLSREESKQNGAGSTKAPRHSHPWPKRSITTHMTITTGELSGCVLSSGRHTWKARLSCAEGTEEGILET